jgi:hypothetical protein
MLGIRATIRRWGVFGSVSFGGVSFGGISFGGVSLAGVSLGGVATLLLGCPIYADDCQSEGDCASGFRCDRFTARCEPNPRASNCRSPEECESGETCAPDFVCRPGSCDFHGCVEGYECGVVDAIHACVLIGATGSDGGVSDAGTAESSADSGVDASLPERVGDAGVTDGGAG